LNISVQAEQIYQIAESIEKIDSVAGIESKFFLPELQCSTVYRATENSEEEGYKDSWLH